MLISLPLLIEPGLKVTLIVDEPSLRPGKSECWPPNPGKDWEKLQKDVSDRDRGPDPIDVDVYVRTGDDRSFRRSDVADDGLCAE